MALPVARVTLQILTVLNWLYGAAILGLVIFANSYPAWFMKAIDVPAAIDPKPIMVGLTAIATLGVLAVPLNHLVLTRLLRMIETVGRADPFIDANANRLHAIAWALLGLQLLSIVIGAIGKAISSKQFPLHLDAGFSVSGWLAVILTFVLLWRMCFAFFIATGSFFLGQQKVMPVAVRGSPLLFALAFAPFAVMLFWLVRIRVSKTHSSSRPSAFLPPPPLQTLPEV